ncbi:hypothetical protein ABG768_010618, partial [Culter alburnus]
PRPLNHGRSRSFQADTRRPELFVTPSLNSKVLALQESQPREPSCVPDGPVRKRNLQLSVGDVPASKCARLNPLTVSLVPPPVVGDENVVKLMMFCCCLFCFPLSVATHTRCADGSLPPTNELSRHFTMTPLTLYAEKWRAYSVSDDKRSSRGSPSRRAREWVLQSLFSGSQKRQRAAPYFGPVPTESSPGKALIQNYYVKTNPLTHPSRGLVCFCGSKRCIFPYLDSPSTQALSEICIRGNRLSVYRPSLRSVFSSTHVHKVHECCSLPSTSERSARSKLSGRLAAHGSF